MGGLVTGASALDLMGAWILSRPHMLHVAVPTNAARLRLEPGVRLHWVGADEGARRGVVGLADALSLVALTAPLETAVSCFDWALHTQRIDAIDFERIMLKLPASASVIRAWVDPASQSVLESVARVRLLQRGWAVRSQVRVGDVGAIDLVIEGLVALELDGREHHEARFEEDREKDLDITSEGRHSIRVTYRLLKYEWPKVERAIVAALAARSRVGQSGVRPPAPTGTRRKRRGAG